MSGVNFIIYVGASGTETKLTSMIVVYPNVRKTPTLTKTKVTPRAIVFLNFETYSCLFSRRYSDLRKLIEIL